MGVFTNFNFNGVNKEFIGTISYGIFGFNVLEKYRLFLNKTSFAKQLSLGSMCFREMIGIHMGQSLLWQTYFCVNLKGRSFFKQKKETCVKLVYFQIPLGS